MLKKNKTTAKKKNHHNKIGMHRLVFLFLTQKVAYYKHHSSSYLFYLPGLFNL